MSWLSIVSYFADSSRLAAIYAVITILILNDSFNNEELVCMQNKDTPVIADINKLCHKRLLFNYSTKLGYYDENNDYNNIKELLRDYSNSIKNITININDFTPDRNYFTISYVRGAHYIEKFKDVGESYNYLDYDANKVWKYVDKIMSKKLFYTDPLYLIKIKSIFGYGGYYHYTYLFHDIKYNSRNDINIICYRIKRNKNIFNLAIYWILVQGMFIASLLKEIILISAFLISLFINYGLIIVYEKCYLKHF